MTDVLGTRTPDLIEPIIGWRGWSLEAVATFDDDGDKVRWLFTSPQQGDTWHGGQLAWNGQCRCGIDVAHEVYTKRIEDAHIRIQAVEHLYPPIPGQRRPQERGIEIQREMIIMLQGMLDVGCSCGINAFADQDVMLTTNYIGSHSVMALGEVDLSGTVRGYERGWRADRGQIVRVWASESIYASWVQEAAGHAKAQFMGVWENQPSAEGEPSTEVSFEPMSSYGHALPKQGDNNAR